MMGQYYLVVNTTKRQFLHAHKFDDGLKLMEFGQSSGGTMTALAILLADGNGRGGGDFGESDPLVGSWAGDKIVIAGDYADEGKFLTTADCEAYKEIPDNKGREPNLHAFARQFYEDISGQVRALMERAGEFKT
jgi:hypothetical protein